MNIIQETLERVWNGPSSFPVNHNYGSHGKKFQDDRGNTYKVESDIIPASPNVDYYGFSDVGGYRQVICDITSYRGSIGAMHYYGSLKVRGDNYINKDGHSCSGYVEKFAPKEGKDFKIELYTFVTKEDKENWARNYDGFEVGDMYPGFLREEDVIKAAKEVFLASFVGKWVLRIDPYSNKPTIFLKSKKRKNAKTVQYSSERWVQDSE